MPLRLGKLSPSLVETNQTSVCPILCHPSCPRTCNACPIFCNPFEAPPPPGDGFDRLPFIPPFIIYFLPAIFFTLMCYFIISRKCSTNINNSGNNRPPQSVQPGVHNHPEENQDAVIDNPIWLIRTVGLQPGIINSIKVYEFKKSEGLVKETGCLVCLCEFQEDESLRILPNCSHAFPLYCIDTWLKSHINCPLCRRPVAIDPDLATTDE